MGWWHADAFIRTPDFPADKPSRYTNCSTPAPNWPLIKLGKSMRKGNPNTACLNTYLRGGADKPLARPTSRCRRMESNSVTGKRGLFMCRIASILSLQTPRGSMSGDARDFNNIETRAVIKFRPPPSCKAKAPKEIHAILINISGGMHHRTPPSKSGWPSLNVVIFPPVMRLVLDDPKQ
jgi:hypothetical protein